MLHAWPFGLTYFKLPDPRFSFMIYVEYLAVEALETANQSNTIQHVVRSTAARLGGKLFLRLVLALLYPRS